MSIRTTGPITIPQLLDREFTDQASLSLAECPAYIIREAESAGGARYSLLLTATLGRRGLMDLLYSLAPYKAHGPDRFPRVLDNWAIFDRAARDAGSLSLFMQHAKSLGSSWQEFSRHRELFMKVLADSSESTRIAPLLSWSTDAAGKRAWRFDGADDSLAEAASGLVGPEGGAGPPVPDTLAGLVTIPYFSPELSRRWPAWKPLVAGGKSNYIGPASVPMMALIHRRALLNNVLVRRAEEYAQEHS